jgi:hypothetical protein
LGRALTEVRPYHLYPIADYFARTARPEVLRTGQSWRERWMALTGDKGEL